MKKTLIQIITLATLLSFTACSTATNSMAQGDLRIFTVDNDPKSHLETKIEKQLEKDGFYISANSEMTKPFMIQFQENSFDVFNLLTVFHKKLTEKLIKQNANAGVFLPMGVGIYQAKGDKQLHVSILTADAQTKILDNNESRVILKEIEQKLIASLKKSMPTAEIAIENDNPLPAKGSLVTTFALEVDPTDWEDDKEELVMTVEDGFKPMGFVMSNFTEYNYMLTKEDTVESPFDFYDTYSICKLKVIYNVAKTRPQAAAFAPCSMMMYKKKGSDKIIMGFPTVYNWMSSARIIDPKGIKELEKAQKDFESILREATE